MRNKLWILAVLLLVGQGLLAQMGLVAHLRMNGDGVDVQGNHSATVNGATLATDRYGRANSAYYFDGEDDYLELSNLDALKFAEYTYSVWVKAEVISNAYMPILSIGGANGDQGLNVANNYYGQTGFTGYGWTNCSSPQVSQGASTGTAENDNWHHVLCTRATGVFKIYIDGVLISTNSAIPSNCPPYYATSQERAVVGMRFNSSKYFKGKLDELKIFNYALDADEVLAVYENSAEIGLCYLDMPEEEGVEYADGVLMSSSLETTAINLSEQITPITFCKISYISDLGDIGLVGLSLQLNSFGEEEESAYVGLGFQQKSGQYYLELGYKNIHIYKGKELIYAASNKTRLGDRIELGLGRSKIHFYKNGLEVGEPQPIKEDEVGRLYLGLTGSAVAVDNIRMRTVCEEQDFDSNAEGGITNSTTYECTDFISGPPYYDLKDELDGTFYDCVSTTVYFRYKESYLSDVNLGYTIYDNNYNDVTAHFTLENVHRQDAKKEHGTSYFKLEGDNMTVGFYILEIYDAKGQAKYLRFKI